MDAYTPIWTYLIGLVIGAYIGWRSVPLYKGKDCMTQICGDCKGYGMIGKIHNDYDDCKRCHGWGKYERRGVLQWLAKTFLKWTCH